MTNPAAGHNQPESGMLAAFIERVQDRERDRRAAVEDIGEICAEAKGQGLDPVTIKKLAKEGLMTESEKAKRDEKEAIEDLYRHALGMTR